MPCEISPRAIAVISVRPEIPPLLRDNLLLSLALQLVFLYSFILIDSIYQLTYTSGRFTSQRLPQAMLSWKAVLEGVDGDVVEVAIRVGLQDLSVMHG